MDNTATDGTPLWYAVTAVDDADQVKAVTALSAVSSPNYTFTFPPGTSMISLGARTTTSDMADIFGVDPGSLLISRWDPTTEDYHRYWETPTDPYLQQALGRAFWLSTEQAIMLNLAGQPAPTGDFSVPYSIGWNMIGNPFTADCDITAATVTTLGEVSRWARRPPTGGLTTCGATTHSCAATSWSVPRSPSARRSSAAARASSSTPSWPDRSSSPAPRGRGGRREVPAVPWTGRSRLWPNARQARTLTTSSACRLQPGKLNAIASPPSTGVDLYFNGPEGVHSAASFGGPGEAPVARAFTVATSQAGPVTLTWPDLTAMPRDLRPVLVDAVTGKRVYMRTSPAYTFDFTGGARAFRLELAADAGALVVQGCRPGPQAPARKVTFTLNRDASVAAEVLDLAGRVVRTLTAGKAAARGELTTLTWDGRSSALDEARRAATSSCSPPPPRTARRPSRSASSASGRAGHQTCRWRPWRRAGKSGIPAATPPSG